MRPEKSTLTPEQALEHQRLRDLYAWRRRAEGPIINLSETFNKICLAAVVISELDGAEEIFSKPEYAHLKEYVIIGNSLKGCDQLVPNQK